MRNSATWLVAVPLDSTQIKEHVCHRRKFFLTALQDAARTYRGPGTGRGNKATSPHSALPPLRTPMLLGCPPLALPGGGGPRRPLAARSSPRHYLLMDMRHLPASSSPRSWRTRCRCLKCGSREHLKGHRDRTTRSSLRALQSHGVAPEHNLYTPARAASPPRFLHLPGGKCPTSPIAILLYLVYSGP